MKRRGIRIIIGTLQLGGAEKHLSLILPGLVDKGWAIRVLLTSCIAPLEEGLVKQGVQVCKPPQWFESPFFTRGIGLKIKLLLNFMRLSWDFIKDRDSMTHFYLPRTYGLGMLAALLTFLRAPKIMSRRSLNNYQRKYKGFHQLEKYFHQKCDLILGNSQAVIDQLHTEEGVSASKLKLIYNGIPLDEQSPIDRDQVRKALGLSKEAYVLCLVANLIPYKGHADLIQALADIKQKLPKEWALLCIGRDDGILSSLQQKAKSFGISDHIQWLLAREDVSSLLAASDVGLLCSHEEGFSNAILEGMRASLPMIVTDVGGNAEAVSHGLTGLVVPPHNPKGLGKAICSLLETPDLARKMGQNGRKRLEALFSLDQCVEAYHEVYSTFGRLS